jgi:hypothetical protein
MSGTRLVELFESAFPDQVSGATDETVRGEIELEVPHAFLEGAPDDIDHRGGVTTYGVFEVKIVTAAGLGQVAEDLLVQRPGGFRAQLRILQDIFGRAR